MTRPAASLEVSWRKPAFLLPLFCLAVLLASTGSLALAIATALVMMVTTLLSSLLYLLRAQTTAGTATALLLAGVITATLELSLHAWFYPLHQQLGLFLPMMAIVGVLLARQELHATVSNPVYAISRALRMSAGYALAAVVLGAARELVARGSLFHEADVLWGAWAAPLEIQLFRADMGFLLAVLAPGAFIALGLGVALYNWLWLRFKPS